MEDKNRIQHHIHMEQGDVGRYVFLPGDPGRCEKIATYFDNPIHVAQNREYNTYTGTLLGEKVSVTSTGIGGPSAAIAVEELVNIGADTFIRVGTSGAMQPEIKTGDVAVVTSAIRDEGTSIHYLPIEYPAIAALEITNTLIKGAKKANVPYHVGPTQSKDSFYGEIEPDRMPVSSRLNERWKAWVSGGAICSEMEASVIFILSSIYRKRAGGVMLMVASEEDEPQPEEEIKAQEDLLDIHRVISVAIEGLKILISEDQKKA